MTGALIILAVLIVTGAILYLLHRRDLRRHPDQDHGPVEPEEQCCGMHITCERDSLLASVSDKIEYFEDEELDAFAGRESDSYTEEEIEQFRDVLLTLLPTDIAPWARSIQLRGIKLPDPVREELLMIVAEARKNSNNQIVTETIDNTTQS